MEYYLAIKKKAEAWMDLEGVMLSEISQKKTISSWYRLYVETKKYYKLVNKTKKDTDIENKPVVRNGEREGG